VEGTLTPLETAKLGLLAAGAATMLYALRPAAQISRELPAGAIRRLWALLRGMIFLFAAGHLLYFVAAIRGRVAIDSFVAITYFFGSCFVLIVCWTAVRTVATVQRVATLRAETTTDDLMGIHNRRYLEKHLLEDVAKTQRYGWPFSVLMLDLDHFKRINDEGGHAAGDAVLRGFGRILRESVRVSDVAARYGGEECVLVLANTKAEGAATLAERVRAAVEREDFSPGLVPAPARPLRCTVSIGVATVNDQTTTGTQILRMADVALYRAKREGRNRCVVHDPAADLPPAPDGR
jgi:diguanylate cyclase (GGDEF)-like protein